MSFWGFKGNLMTAGKRIEKAIIRRHNLVSKSSF
jgi:hypothetical protein